MSKLLRLSDHILLGAALAGEAFDEFRLVGGLVPAAMNARYGWVPPLYRKASYLSTVSQLLRTGHIRKVTTSTKEVILELTDVGQKRIRRFSLLQLSRRKWDGSFMIVVFDIEEKHKKTRDRLRDKLCELGFGMLQESVWISPHHFEEDLQEFLRESGLKDEVFVLKAQKLWEEDFKRLALRVWKLNEINSSYYKVILKLSKALTVKDKPASSLVQGANKLYLETLASDPLLPVELLPSDWSREPALKLLNSF